MSVDYLKATRLYFLLEWASETKEERWRKKIAIVVRDL